MHVVHVVHTLAVGGTENGVVNLVNATRRELRHTVIAMTEVGALADRLPAGVEVHRLGKRPGWDLAAVGRLVRLLRRLRPDIVHSRNWAALDAVPAARAAGVRIVVHGEHGREVRDPEGRDPRRRRVRRLVAPLVTRFVAVSADLRRWLIEDIGIPASKVEGIPNGVDTSRFGPDLRAEGRRELGVAPGVVVIGTVSRLDPVKDHLGLLEACAVVIREHPAVVVAVVGDGPCRAEVTERASVLGVGDRVRFLGQRLDVPRLLAGFDVFALPSIAEGMSNTILEAMASGVPVVATRVGGSPDLVDEGVTGALVPVGDRTRLAGALVRYATDAQLREIHGKACRERALGEFSLERMARRHLDLYASLAPRAMAGFSLAGRG